MFIYNDTLLDIKGDISIINQLKIKSDETIDILVFEEFYQILFQGINIPPLMEKETIKICDILDKFEKLTGLKKTKHTFIYNAK